jgi:hypothetical protein
VRVPAGVFCVLTSCLVHTPSKSKIQKTRAEFRRFISPSTSNLMLVGDGFTGARRRKGARMPVINRGFVRDLAGHRKTGDVCENWTSRRCGEYVGRTSVFVFLTRS